MADRWRRRTIRDVRLRQSLARARDEAEGAAILGDREAAAAWSELVRRLVEIERERVPDES